jgi:hypothetical protein
MRSARVAARARRRELIEARRGWLGLILRALLEVTK